MPQGSAGQPPGPGTHSPLQTMDSSTFFLQTPGSSHI